jgi:hypothetical protein
MTEIGRHSFAKYPNLPSHKKQFPTKSITYKKISPRPFILPHNGGASKQKGATRGALMV